VRAKGCAGNYEKRKTGKLKNEKQLIEKQSRFKITEWSPHHPTKNAFLAPSKQTKKNSLL
jgi:hypothetical protein